MGDLLSIQKGSIVGYKGVTFEISDISDFEHLVARNISTGESSILHRSEVQVAAKLASEGIPDRSSEHIAEKYWKIAEQRHKDIMVLLGQKNRTDADYEKRAAELGLHKNTLYEWVGKFESTGRISSLVPKYNERGGKGKTRFPDAVEKIITRYLTGEEELEEIGKDGSPKRIVHEDAYMSNRNWEISEVHRKIKDDCMARGIKYPAETTIRNRVLKLDQHEAGKKRKGIDYYKSHHQPAPGNFPDGNYPLDVVEIDHIQVPAIVVDEITRQPSGKPYLVLAEDVYSRAAWSFYLTPHPPSTFTLGQCILRGLLPKDKYVRSLGIQGKWGVYGFPRILHSDNAPEFQGMDLDRFAEDHHFTLEFRRTRTPEDGGLIERLNETLKKRMYALPGTTFGNPTQRGDYDSVGKSCMTMKELEQWIANFLLTDYHINKHSGINDMLPIRKYELGINGEPEEGGAVGVGLQDVFPDEDLLRIELLPSVLRTVQKTGIQNENFRYYADVLRRWINLKDPETGKSMYYVVKYDPRDLSIVYFLDPELKRYFPVPYRTLRNPKISLWETRDAKKDLKLRGITHPDEQQIFESHMRGRAIVEKAEADTRAARRKRSAKRHDEETVKDTGPKLGKEETTAKQKAGKETQGAGGPSPVPRVPRTDIDFIDD